MEKVGPWTKISSEVKYKSPWMEVIEDKVIHSDGKERIYSISSTLDSVTVLPVDSEGNVYLVRQFRYCLNGEYLEAPAGNIDEGEKPLDAAKRELKEELGISANEWISLGTMIPQETLRKTSNLYLARDLQHGEPNPEESKWIKEEVMPLKEAVEKVMRNEIVHWASVGVILKTNNYLNKNK